MSARSRVATAMAVGATAGFLLLAPPASADGLPPMQLSATTVTPTGTITASGTGCIAPDGPDFGGGSVFILAPHPVTVKANSTGSWSATLQFTHTPSSSQPIQATCSYGSLAGMQQKSYPSVRVTVVGTPNPTPLPAPPPEPRPATTHPSPPATTPGAPPPPTPTGPAPATAASGCVACARIASGAPLGAGWPVSLRYTGFQPHERVALVMHSTPFWLGSFTADDSGVVTASVRIPEEAPAGPHTFVFTGPASGERDVSLRVTAAAPVAPERPAPESSAPILLAAVGAAVGLALVAGGAVVHRRRRHHGRASAAAS